ncbi:GNAT family N-acetyltransferase [Gryllotalpicola reticulitermitis]|uniref:GNAT family N-acetyltransferase n=1 Tax=Gryllotalpicola reticulitermitis TaxID=1184153 RepID=A0ABV8QBC8_9MICO
MGFEHTPVDPTSAERLATSGLELRLVDTAEHDDFDRWLQADQRGFHMAKATPASLAELRATTAHRRSVGVYDPQSPAPGHPVGTTQTWVTPLTVPGGATIDMWAVSSVTVSPTHRRRGVARALLEGELRAAAGDNVPMVGLTVSEATIYSRFGFGVATFTDSAEIETRRVRWSGPDAPGRLHFVDPDVLLPDAATIIDAVRSSQPGGLSYDDHFVGSVVGTIGDDRAGLRAVRYDDADGRPMGFASYRLRAHETDFAKHTATVQHLIGATDEATAALWRYLLELDLVATVRAPGRPVDEPVHWQLGDLRAATRRRRDALWLRILDVPAVLGARRYATAAAVVLEVSDPYGFTAGRFLLETDAEGAGHVEQFDGATPAGAASVALSIGDLSSLYLGGVSAATLARAGRIEERSAGAAFALERMLAVDRAPWLILGF